MSKDSSKDIQKIKKEIADDYRKIEKIESRKYIQIVSLLMGIMLMILLYMVLAY